MDSSKVKTKVPASDRKRAADRKGPSETSPLLESSGCSSRSASPSDGCHGDSADDYDDYDDDGGSLSNELWILVKYALPLICTYLLQYAWCIIVTFTAGHLSTDDLAAASIGMTTMNILGWALFEGMATSLDTLCSQSYGSGNLTGVGLHVQSMMLLMSLVAVPIGILWATAPWLLTLFVRQQHLPAMAGTFLRWSILGMPGYAYFEALKRFLQAQGSFRPAMVVLLITTPINVLLSWLFAFKLGMGLSGAALGVALTNDLRPLLLVLYIASPLGRWSHQCWGGFSREALNIKRWRPMAKLSLAGAVVNLAEWGSFQIVAFTTSYLSTAHLAAQTLLTTISVVSWHIPFSISVGISTRIGNLIGAGRKRTARRASLMYAVVFIAVGAIDGLIIFLVRESLPRFFSQDPEVWALAAKTFLALALYQIIDSFICFTNGMLRGLGRQAVAAWVVILVNYLAAVPCAVWLELGPPAFALNGVWTGLGCGMVVIAAIECTYLRWLDWQKCVNKVSLREGH